MRLPFTAGLAMLLAACGGGSDDAPRDPPGWLHTGIAKIHTDDGRMIEVPRILDADGQVWMGRGANLHDTRSCDACAYDPLEVVDALGVHRQVDELKRRADALLGWGANYVHLVMDARALPDGRVQYRNVADDPAYFDAIAELVDHLTARQVYVLLYLHDDPCLGETPGSTPAQPRHIGAVGPACDRVWTALATRFRANPYVQYGLAAEPNGIGDGTPNDCSSLGLCSEREVRDSFDARVAVIRAVEDKVRPELPRHLIAVQGLSDWGRWLDVYLQHPITAGGGRNIVYETHPYNVRADFDGLVFDPALHLPVIIGEFGPVEGAGAVTATDVRALIRRAESEKIPYLAWSFHQHCPPNLLVDHRLDADAPVDPADAASPGSGYELCYAPPRAGKRQMPLDPAPYALSGPRGPGWGTVLYCAWNPGDPQC